MLLSTDFLPGVDSVGSKHDGFFSRVSLSTIFRKIGFAFLLVLMAINTMAQSNIGMPNFTPAPSTPNSAALGKYGETPVGLFTGVPEIGIPLYGIKLKAMEIPIAMSYYAGGIKVNDIASDVGLGWSLNAGGAITCSVNGIPDLEPGGWLETAYRSAGYSNNTDSWQAMCNVWESLPNFNLLNEAVVTRTVDTQPDMFFLSMPGKSIKFFFDENAEIVTVPYDPVKIEFLGVNQGFRVTNEQDIVFEFKNIEYTNTNYQFNKSYQLSKITTPNQETVMFNYETAQSVSAFYNQPSETRYFTTDLGPCEKDMVVSTSFTNVYSYKLSSIASSTGDSVTFGYGFNRLDLPGNKALTSIKVYHKSAPAVLKEYSLAYSHMGGAGATHAQDNYRLRLLSVTEAGKPAHQFFYNVVDLPVRLSYSQDHWGYYNAKSNNTLLPMDAFNNFPVGADREPVDFAMAAGMLRKIVYPTGGSTVFEFEPNKVAEARQTQQPQLATALAMDNTTRVKYFTVGSGASTFVVKHELTEGPYFDNGQSAWVDCKARILDAQNNIVSTFTGTTSSMGMSYQTLAPGNYAIEIETTGSYPGTFRLDWLEYSFQIDTLTFGGLRVKEIKDYTGNEVGLASTKRYDYRKENGELSGRNNFTVKSSYVYDLPHMVGVPDGHIVNYITCHYIAQSSNVNTSFVKGSTVHYTDVSVYNDTKTDGGYTHYRFSSLPGSSSKPVYPFAPLYSYDWLAGLPIETKTYKHVEGNIYTPVKKVENEYNMVHGTNNPALHARYVKGFNSVQVQEKLCPYGSSPIFWNEFYGMVSSWPFLKKSVETNYDAADSTKRTTVLNNYFYDNPAHVQLTRQEVTKSNGEKYKLSFRYPKDVNAAYAYISSPVVEKRVMVDDGLTDKLIAAELTTYQNAGGVFPTAYYGLKLPAPVANTAIPAYTGGTIDSNFEKRMEYGYDAKNSLVSEIKDEAVKSNYLYSYNGVYPVAIVKDVDYASVVAAVGGVSAVATFSAKAKPTPAELTNFFAMLRNNLPAAMIATYVYEPLVGITSQTDAKGMTTYYEYDGLNRLKTIKDHKGHVVKNFAYHYTAAVYTLPDWTDTGVRSCETVGGVNTGNELMQQVDYNPNSPSYNTFRTRNLGVTGNCPTTVYAKIYYENLSVTPLRTKADIVVRFFSDAACTVPVSVASINVPYKIFDDQSNLVYSGSVTGNGTSAVIEYQGFIQQNDEFGTPVIFYEYVLGTSSAYTIVH